MKNVNYSIHCAYFIGIMLSFFLVGCQQSADNSQSIPIKLSVSTTPLSSPLYVAEALGYFDNGCVNVSIIDTIGGKNSFEKVSSGEADFGTSSDSVIVFKSFLRNDFSNIATFVQSDNDVKLIALADSQIHMSNDLFGKRIGLTKGAAGEYLLSTYLALEGVGINDVDIISYAPNALSAALLNKEVDLIVPWEPYAYEALNTLEAKTKVIDTKNLYTLTFNLISRPLQTDKQVKGATCILSALNKAMNFIASNPEQAKEIVVKRLGLDKRFLDWVWPDYIFKLSLNNSLLMNMESQAAWALSSGLVKKSTVPDFKGVIDPSVLAKVNPMAVTIH